MLDRLGARDDGAAVADFVMIMVLLVPLFLGIFQVGLVLHVRNTLTACASEGARYGANFNRDASDGVARTRECIGSSLSSKWSSNVSASMGSSAGVPVVVVNADTVVPALGLWGRLVDVHTSGHAVKERV